MNDAPRSYGSVAHWDRVTAAWTLLMGEEVHYGVFRDGSEDLAAASQELTRLMTEAARIEPGSEVLDVGCGTGAPACLIASEFGASVTGITTSQVGVEAAKERAEAEGLSELLSFEVRDGMDNQFPAASFDRVWVLQASHAMRRRDLLMSETARVLRPGGRLALCDIMLKRRMDFAEVRRLREPLALLRDVYGDARMETPEEYRRLAEASGLVVEEELDLTADTRPTFDRWRRNAAEHADQVVELIGEDPLRRFVEASVVLEGFWDDGTLGYGLLAASKY